LTFWFLCLCYVANWLLLCKILNFYQLRRFIYDKEGDGTETPSLLCRGCSGTEFHPRSEKLHTSQPSLSSQIRDLEQCVGVSLLERDKRTVTLTAAGESFLADALAILDQAEQAKIRARSAAIQNNHLVIGFVPSAEVNLLPMVMPLLRLRQPKPTSSWSV
jgi:LysR family hca operon transcriptional activator